MEFRRGTDLAGIAGMLERRISRRTALRGAGAAGVASTLAGGIAPRAFAQEASPVADVLSVYPEITITAAEYSFELPSTIPGGLTRLTLVNQGAEDHHAIFLKLNDDVTPDAFAPFLESPDLGPVFGSGISVGGPGTVGPGEKTTVIVDLAEGQYVVFCAIPGPDGMPHYMMGMHTLLEVTSAEAAPPPPSADAAIGLVDFGFDSLPMEVTTGQHLWQVSALGQQPHELAIFQLAPGVTPEQVQAIFSSMESATPEAAAAPMASPVAGPPPFTSVAGVAPISPTQKIWLVVDLEAGDYIAICFVPDSASGAPHFALGMIMPFTVA